MAQQPVQVFYRKKSAARDGEVVLAEVLGTRQNGELLRLQVPGMKEPIEVMASDTLPVSCVAPGQARIVGNPGNAPEKCYALGAGALAHELY